MPQTGKNDSSPRSRTVSSTTATQVGPEQIGRIYDELRKLAQHYFRNERPGHTLQPTALVHEAYIRLAGRKLNTEERAHFLALCAKVMRQVLVDYARGKRRLRRGGKGQRVELDSRISPADVSEFDLISIHEAIEKLSELDPREAQIVEMRFFGGLTVAEVAAVLDVSKRTIEGDWEHAKAWLRRNLSETPE